MTALKHKLTIGRIILRVLAIVVAIGFIGNLFILGFINPVGIILCAIFTYYGWRKPKSIKHKQT